MAISAVTVADSISSMSFSSGLAFTFKVRDLNEMTNEVLNRDCPVVMPAPNWFSVSDVEKQNLGTGSSARWNLEYILTYRIFSIEAGMERTIGDATLLTAQHVMAFLDEIFENDSITGAIDMELAGAPTFGIVEEPSGKSFYGADIELRILEFIN